MAELELSIVVPLYNEAGGIKNFHEALLKTAREASPDSYEMIYVDDGSSDDTDRIIKTFATVDSRIKLMKLSRNFGKENALAAGIAEAKGKAVLTIDGDGQHPVQLIPQFIKSWQAGAKVVIGVRTGSSSDGIFKKLGSSVFYKLFNRLTGQKLIPNSTDYRLIDRVVQKEFLKLEETDRMTRALIDWLGFKREYIKFDAGERGADEPGYSWGKLVHLATNSFVSLTTVPLYIFGYIGVFITGFSAILGSAVFVEQIILNDPLSWEFSGTAMIGILLLFLVGIVLMSQGILSLYISHIHAQTKKRPLYIIDYEGSKGVKQD